LFSPDAEKHAASFQRRHAAKSNARARATDDEPVAAFIVVASERAKLAGEMDEPHHTHQH
jgi:hypothetical protein